jgi:hypothetical protein
MLQLVQAASVEMGLASPTAVAGNTATDVVQTLALINAVGGELARQHQWQAMTTEYRFTTQYLSTTGTWTTSAATVTGIPTTAALAAGTWSVLTGNGIPTDTTILTVDSGTQVTLSQTPTAAGTAASIIFAQTKYTFPADYDRLIDKTDWDKSKRWEMLGPETAQQWQWLKSGNISSGPRIRYRPLGGYFQTYPGMASNEYLGFEYVSKYWVAVTGATALSKASFTVDTDTCIWPDRLMILGTKVKYFGIKGFNIGAPDQPGTLMYDYTMQLNLAKAHDAGSPTLSMAPRISSVLIQPDQIQDTGYGQ